MATQPIQTKDIIQDNVLKKTIAEFEAWSNVIKIVEKDLTELAGVTKKGIKLIDENDSKSIVELNSKLLELKKQTKALDLAKKESIKASNNVIKLRKEESEAKKKNTLLTNSERVAIQQVNAANRESNAQAKLIVTLANSKAGSIENLRAKLSFVTNEWKKLTAEELENTKRGKRLVASKKELTATLLKLEQTTGDNRRQVGNYSKALGGLRGQLINVANAAGLTGGVFAAFSVLKSSITLLRDFEKANATLAGVLNKSKEETKELRDNAVLLGSTTVKTAQEVTKLQTAYARLGFTQQQILDVTEATVNGSIALNAGLDETAELVGAVVNSYDDLNTTDAAKITEILAASTTKTALSFSQLATALPIVSGAANAVGVPLEEVTALLGKLSDSGIDASSSSTALRNVFIESAARGINYKEAIQQITDSQDKLTTANELFGKRGAVSALIVSNNTSKVAELTKELEKAAVVQSLVDKEVDTLDGSIKLLTSSWEGYVLGVGDSLDANNILKTSIRFLADNLRTIFGVLKVAAVGFVAYKTAIVAANLATKLSITINTAASIATNARTIATNIATAAQKAFNAATKANVIGVIIALLAAAVTAYLTFGDAVAQAAQKQRDLNEVRKKGAEQEAKIIKKEEEISNKRLDILRNEIEVRTAAGENVLSLEKEFADERLKEIVKQQEEDKAAIEKFNAEILKIETDAQEKIRIAKAPRKQAASFGGSSFGGSSGVSDQLRTNSAIAETKKLNDALDKGRADLEGKIKERNDNIKRLNKSLSDIDQKLLVNSVKTSKKLVKNQIDRNKELNVLRRRLQDLQNESIKGDEEREIAIATTKFNREIAAIKGNSKTEIAIRLELENALQRSLKEIRVRFDNEKEADRKADEEKRKAGAKKRKEDEQKIRSELNNLVQEDLDGQIEELQRFADKQDSLSIAQVDSLIEINELKKEKLKEQYDFELQEQELSINEKLLIESKYRNDLKELEDFDPESERIKKEADADNKANEQRLQRFKDLQGALVQALENALNARFERIQAELDKELDANQKQQDRLQNLADKGNKDALESLQEEREKEQEIEKEKARRERQQANLQKGVEIYKILSSNGGDVAKTITDVALLEALIQSIPAFEKGTEDTGSGGKGVDGKGGFHALLHPNEGVIKSKTNKKKLKAGLTNETAIDYAIKYQHLKPKMNEKKESKPNNQELKNIEKILKELPNNMPTQDLFFDEQEKAYVRIIKQDGKVNRIHSRSKGLFR